MIVKGKKETAIDLHLSMTESEAMVLYSLMQVVGGSPGGPRGVAMELTRALRDLGIQAGNSYVGRIMLPDSWDEFKKDPAK